MSYNVLVIPEDFTKDEHILKPLVQQVLADAGRPRAVVEVCRNPNFQGISEALKWERLRDEVVKRYPMVSLFLLFVDRDGSQGREAALEELVARLSASLKAHQRFLTEVARQEIEIFPLAGFQLEPGQKWSDIRADANVKDTYFQRLVEREALDDEPHQGRKRLMASAMRKWSRIQSRCPEETVELAARIQHLN